MSPACARPNVGWARQATLAGGFRADRQATWGCPLARTGPAVDHGRMPPLLDHLDHGPHELSDARTARRVGLDRDRILGPAGPVVTAAPLLEGGRVKKKGRIKFSDEERGYGYILADDASTPAETTLFMTKDVSPALEALTPGTEVVFEVEPDEPSAPAREVDTA